MRRDILVWPDDGLKVKSLPIDWTKFDMDEFFIDIHDLMDTFWKAGKQAVGLSGVQINWPYRLFLMRNNDGNDVTFVANPEIVQLHGEPVKKMEGCLSFPGVFEEVMRYQEVSVKYDSVNPADLTHHAIEEKLSGLEAQVFQHESEHLDGGVLTDKLTPAKVKTIRNRLNKWKMKGYHWP